MTVKIPSFFSRTGILFGLSVVLLGYQVGDGARWFAMDLSARFLPSLRRGIDPQIVDFVNQVSLWQELILFAAVVCVWISFALLLMRRIEVLYFYLASFLLSKIDWILSATAGFDFLAEAGFRSLVWEAAALTTLLLLWQMGFFARTAITRQTGTSHQGSIAGTAKASARPDRFQDAIWRRRLAQALLAGLALIQVAWWGIDLYHILWDDGELLGDENVRAFTLSVPLQIRVVFYFGLAFSLAAFVASFFDDLWAFWLSLATFIAVTANWISLTGNLTYEILFDEWVVLVDYLQLVLSVTIVGLLGWQVWAKHLTSDPNQRD